MSKPIQTRAIANLFRGPKQVFATWSVNRGRTGMVERRWRQLSGSYQ